MSTVTIRPAVDEQDRAAVYRMRYQLYVEDQGHYLDEADHERRWLHDDYDACSRILLAECAGEVVGSVRVSLGREMVFDRKARETYEFDRFRGIVEDRDIAVMGRLLVKPEHRGGTLCFELIEASCALLADLGMELLLANCKPHLVSHYSKFGYRPFGALHQHPTNAVAVRIGIVLGDFDFLRRVNAPTLAALGRRTRSTLSVPRIVAALEEGAAARCQKLEDADAFQAEVESYLRDGYGMRRGDLAALDPRQMATLLEGSQILRCQAGDALYYRGQTSRTLFVVLAGSLRIENEMGARTCSEIGRLVGPRAYFVSGRRMSDVVAGAGGATVLAICNHTLRRILASPSALASELRRVVSRDIDLRPSRAPGGKEIAA